MNEIDHDLTLASLVTQRPDLATHLNALGLDFCCGGHRRLVDAIDESGLDLAETIAALDAAATNPSSPTGDTVNWRDFTMAEMVDHLESTHHVYLSDALVRLDALAEKVAGVHGERHPELSQVLATFRALRADLEPHLRNEEQVLFPMIREMEEAATPSLRSGAIGDTIGALASEHDRAGALLARLRALTDAYTVPDDGCASYQLLYTGLADLEADTHLHVHKENNLLFPQVLAGVIAGVTDLGA